MRRSLIFLLLLMVVFSPLIRGFSSSEISQISLSSPNREGFKLFNSLLPPKPKYDLALVAALDGTIYLVDTGSGEIQWSFSSGAPIYSSYQDILDHDSNMHVDSERSNDFYIDCGDDWQLYVHSKSLGKVKLSLSAEEYIRRAPYVSEDGGITVGAKKTTVFLVDAKSGKVIRTYSPADSASTLGVQSAEENPVLLVKGAEELVESGALGMETVQQLVYVMRTDFMLQYYSSNSRKVLWNVAFAEIEAEFRCLGIENSFNGGSSNSENNISAEDTGDMESPFPCQMRASVLRIRDHSLPMFDRLANIHPKVLSLPASNYNPPLATVDRLPLAPRNNEDGKVLALPPPKIENPGVVAIVGGEASKMFITSSFSEVMARSHTWSFFPFVATILSIICFIFYHSLAFGRHGTLKKQAEDIKVRAGIPKKKKSRRSGNSKNSPNSEKRQIYISQENSVGDTNGLPHIEENERKPLPTFSNLVDGHVDGRRIGKLLVSNKEIAKGSNGTIVLEGIYDGRPVAVKRLVQTHHDVALKEIQNLIASDRHPNIVRWYGVEYDQDFVYISLERCTCSLNDLIYLYSESFESRIITKDQNSNFLNEYVVRLHSMMEIDKNIELWKANGHPSPQLLKLMRDVVSGLAHLHELGIIHRDLKPQNVLIIKERSLYAKLSDMGISKRLLGEMSSLTQHATGYGSSGWQAPEQLLHGRQTRAVDLFSLGCVLFFCVTGGKHPYGDSFERDVNIVNDRKDFFLVENMPEAVDLFSHLLDSNPDMRPKAQDVLHHPLFWTSEMRLSFLRDASDRVELEDRENESELLKALENIAAVALNGKWDEKMETVFLNNIGRYRRYKFDSVRDLLRVIRNKLNHYRELPQEIQELLGQVPEGFHSYFSSRFPKLLIEVYKVIYTYCKEEEFFCKYINSNLI